MNDYLKGSKKWVQRNLIILIMIIGISSAVRHFLQGRWLAGLSFLAWSAIVSLLVFISVKKYDPEH